jgi:hypothetical protein
MRVEDRPPEVAPAYGKVRMRGVGIARNRRNNPIQSRGCGAKNERGEVLAEALRTCAIPIIGVLGNHDYESVRRQR